MDARGPVPGGDMASRPFRKLILPGIVLAAFWALGITAWRLSGYVQPLALFGYVGSSLLIAKIVGPLLFGRLWCGWACWTLMVLDLLPYQRSPGRLPSRWGWLRYAHFASSLGLVALLWWGFRYRDPIHFGSAAGLVWLLVGNGFYYAVGVGMAFALRVSLGLDMGWRERLRPRLPLGKAA